MDNGTPWCLQQSASLSNGLAEVTFLSAKSLDQASLISTLNGGFTGDRTWTETAATLVDNGGGSYTLSAALPEYTTAWFINGLSGALVASSDYQETGVPPPSSVVYDITANWSSKTVNGNDNVIITSGAAVTLDQDDTALALTVDDGALQVDQAHSLSLNGLLAVSANGAVSMNRGTLSPSGATTTIDGSVTLNGGNYTRDIAGVASVGHTFAGGGILRVQSGLLSLPNGAPTDVIRLNTDLEISGGTVDLSGQIYVGSSGLTPDFTVIGDAATIIMQRLNQRPVSHSGVFNFILDESGVSTITLNGWVHLQNATITVDGSDYTGGPANILLFDSLNLATLADPANISVTGFSAQGLTASVVQDDASGKDWVELVIQNMNQPPAFLADSLNEVSAMETLAYSSTLADDASDPESDPMTFSKVSGPAWLSVAAEGTLFGTPGAGDVGANVFTVRVDSTGGSDTATLSLSVEEFMVADSAQTETPAQGTISGSLGNTFVNDDIYEVITEVLDAAPTSLLEHQWTFDVYGAELVTFYVEAHHSANVEGDDIVFAYSTNQVDWVDMVTVVKTADDNTVQFYSLQSELSGTVYVRAVDVDRSVNNTVLDSLYVDSLFIVSELPSVVPNPATAPSPSHTATDVPLSQTLSWSQGAQASSRDVYFGVNPTPGAAEFQGNQLGTSFDPGVLDYSTTYYWAIDEVNSLGATLGGTWSFMTIADSPQWTELTYDDFESGWGNWLDGGTDALLSSVQAIGTTCMNLQDNTSTSVSELNGSLDLTGYTSLKIEFSYVVSSFEGSERFWVRFSDNGGATWTMVKAFVNNVDFIDNGTRYYPELILDSGSYNFTPNVKIQFVCDASGNQDDVYIDNIRISALANAEPPAPASTPSPANGATQVSLSAQLDWVAGLGASSNNVYFGTSPSPAFLGSQAGTGFDPGLLDLNTTYYWAVDEVNSFGTTAGLLWSFTTTASAPLWTELTYDDFESGWGNWIDGGSDALLSLSYAIGTTSMDLQDDSTTSEAELAAALDLTGYSQLKIEFSYVVQSFEGAEDFWVRFSENGGSTWTTIKAFVNDVDFVDNGTRYNPELIIDSGSYTFNNNVLIKFECDASRNNDDVYFDNIRISAK